MKFNNKIECYNYYKELFEINNIEISDYKDINYGLQFNIVINETIQTMRIYESKKNGVKVDFSLIKNREIAGILQRLGSKGENESNSTLKAITSKNKLEKYNELTKLGEADIEGNPIIGTDESGKGDYFGPLVIAGVYADEEMKKKLKAIGVDDSKKLKDSHIVLLASKIKNICKYKIIVIGNQKYNKLYEKVGNLNKLLAWGHARAIENILQEVECKIALSDQFGNPELIKNALMSKGKKIHLEQRPRAEENIVVAAASILARNEFIERIGFLTKRYELEFPKGTSSKTIEIGRKFVEKYGRENLSLVAKLHFKTTSEI